MATGWIIPRFKTNNLTAFGKLYSEWDGDAAVRTDKTYYIHNKSTRKRLANLLGSGPNARSIRVDDHSPRWTLVSTGASNRYHLVSSRDGRRLGYASASITLAAATTSRSTLPDRLRVNHEFTNENHGILGTHGNEERSEPSCIHSKGENSILHNSLFFRVCCGFRGSPSSFTG